MKLAFTVAAIAILAASGTTAQTAQETMDTEGLSGFTNLEVALGREIARAGVPEECMGQMPMSVVRQISALAVTEGDTEETRDKVKLMIEEVCGNLD